MCSIAKSMMNTFFEFPNIWQLPHLTFRLHGSHTLSYPEWKYLATLPYFPGSVGVGTGFLFDLSGVFVRVTPAYITTLINSWLSKNIKPQLSQSDEIMLEDNKAFSSFSCSLFIDMSCRPTARKVVLLNKSLTPHHV